jgi:signal peptidase II
MKITQQQWYKTLPWFVLALIVIGIDQWSKIFVFHHLEFEKPLTVLPFFNVVLRFNRGAAFSILGQWHGLQIAFLSGISIVVIIFVFIWLLRLKYPDAWTACALALLLGGAVGNLIDRLMRHYVVDFLDFHLGSWHYATFNLADSAIVISVDMLLIKTFLWRKKEEGGK